MADVPWCCAGYLWSSTSDGTLTVSCSSTKPVLTCDAAPWVLPHTASAVSDSVPCVPLTSDLVSLLWPFPRGTLCALRAGSSCCNQNPAGREHSLPLQLVQTQLPLEGEDFPFHTCKTGVPDSLPIGGNGQEGSGGRSWWGGTRHLSLNSAWHHGIPFYCPGSSPFSLFSGSDFSSVQYSWLSRGLTPWAAKSH